MIREKEFNVRRALTSNEEIARSSSNEILSVNLYKTFQGPKNLS